MSLDLPEDHAVEKIMELLRGMDGMTNCMALGILSCCQQEIYQSIQGEDDEEDWKK